MMLCLFPLAFEYLNTSHRGRHVCRSSKKQRAEGGAVDPCSHCLLWAGHIIISPLNASWFTRPFLSVHFIQIKFLLQGNLEEVDTRRDKVHLSAKLRQTATSFYSFLFFISVCPHFATAPHLYFFISAFSLHTPSLSLSILFSPTAFYCDSLTSILSSGDTSLLHLFHSHSIFSLFILPTVSAAHSTR